MNKKVHEDYRYIKDIYSLQCICTELRSLLQKKDKEIDRLNKIRGLALGYLEVANDIDKNYLDSIILGRTID